MDENMISNAIRELSNSLGMGANEIIPHYVRWILVKNIIGTFLSVLGSLSFLMVFFSKNFKEYFLDDINYLLFRIFMISLSFCSILFLLATIPNIFSPTKTAIDMLFKNIIRIVG